MTGLNWSARSQVDIVVERDGLEVSHGHFKPIYTNREVNGPGCGVTSFAETGVNIE